MALTLDTRTVDSTLAFLVGQLEKLDPIINMPLQAVTWSRDVQARTDLSLGHDNASYTLSNYASLGDLADGSNPANGATWGMSITGKAVNAPSSIDVDMSKISQPLHLWAKRVSYSIAELASSQMLSQPVDVQKVEALIRAHQLQMDQAVYVGNPALSGFTGLYNNATVAAQTAIQSTNTWSTATPAQIQSDINALIAAVVSTSATAEAPNVVLVSYEDMSILTQPITTAGSISVKEFIEQNNLARSMGVNLEIRATKWSKGAGTGGRTRVVAFNNDKRYIQYPFVPLQRTPIAQNGSQFLFDYVGRFGQLEVRYPEVMGYLDHVA